MTDSVKEGKPTRECPKCGEHACSLVGDGYDETYLCMVCHFDAGRYFQNTPERSGTAREAPSTNRNGTTVGPRAAAHLTSPPVEDRIAEIRARADNAEPGPWIHGDERLPVLTATGCLPHRHIAMLESVRYDGWKGNAEFITHAREDIPWLLTELTAAQSRERALGKQVFDLTGIVSDKNDKIAALTSENKALKELLTKVRGSIHITLRKFDEGAWGELGQRSSISVFRERLVGIDAALQQSHGGGE